MPKLFAKTCRIIEFQAGSCLYVAVAVKAASHVGTAYVAAAAEACSRLVGVCRSLRVMSSSPPIPAPPAMLPFPAGLAPTEGIPMVAQAVLHREILHVHASLELILGILRTRLALPSWTGLPALVFKCSYVAWILPSFKRCRSPIPPSSTLMSHELMTTFGFIHTLHHSPEQLDAELRGRTSFVDPCTLFSPIPDSRPSTSTASTTATPLP